MQFWRDPTIVAPAELWRTMKIRACAPLSSFQRTSIQADVVSDATRCLCPSQLLPTEQGSTRPLRPNDPNPNFRAMTSITRPEACVALGESTPQSLSLEACHFPHRHLLWRAPCSGSKEFVIYDDAFCSFSTYRHFFVLTINPSR